mmetsp:Transcript_29780/g.74880  ORF Transcript_29780/g.74880 Transcript_29780/m.74880 type:complete len:267 (-) Transcript_29780:464-1264(-)
MSSLKLRQPLDTMGSVRASLQARAPFALRMHTVSLAALSTSATCFEGLDLSATATVACGSEATRLVTLALVTLAVHAQQAVGDDLGFKGCNLTLLLLRTQLWLPLLLVASMVRQSLNRGVLFTCLALCNLVLLLFPGSAIFLRRLRRLPCRRCQLLLTSMTLDLLGTSPVVVRRFGNILVLRDTVIIMLRRFAKIALGLYRSVPCSRSLDTALAMAWLGRAPVLLRGPVVASVLSMLLCIMFGLGGIISQLRRSRCLVLRGPGLGF